MLGRDVVTELRAGGELVRPMRRADLDITDPYAVDDAVEDLVWDHADSAGFGHPVVVNLAAWTDVDGAEQNEDRARAVNADGARKIAWACGQFGARMIHISTDYVFDGTETGPYPEDAPVSPRSAYGRTKAAGERAVLETLPDSGVVLRTAWLYGAHGASFVKAIVRRAREAEYVDVVADQHGQPTWTADLARRIIEVGHASRASGIYHATNAGSASRYEWARAVVRELGMNPERVRPTTSTRFPRPAPRPAYSVLGHARWSGLGLPPMRPWTEAFAAAAVAGVLDVDDA